MDIKDEKRRLGIVLCQDIREFEQKTGFEVKGIKIERDHTGIESVIPKVEIPE